MADPLLELIMGEDALKTGRTGERDQMKSANKYLSRILSLHPTDLTTTEPQSLSQSSQSTTLSLQALSSRSQRSTIASSDQLAALRDDIPSLTSGAGMLKTAVPALDESAVKFSSKYSRVRSGENQNEDSALLQRKEAMLYARQSEKLQDILELPLLLKTSISSASSGSAGSTNYSQALDLLSHIKRLRVLCPDSKLVRDVAEEANEAMQDMTTSLMNSLRGQNLRLPAAIRTIGWLRRVVPELSSSTFVNVRTNEPNKGATSINAGLAHEHGQSEGSLGVVFLVARLSTFLSMTEVALAPLRDLADQETEKRLQMEQAGKDTNSKKAQQGPSSIHGQQTERYLKRYVEIFREQSFATLQMYRNIFPAIVDRENGDIESTSKLPSAIASFPLHLVSLLMETLKTYLPNISDVAARESLLIQVLYAASSLGRLGADFSMLISLLDLSAPRQPNSDDQNNTETEQEPEWYRIIKKHRIQAARLDALASGQERRVSQDVAVR